MFFKIIRPGAFMLAMLCFTLPFIKVSCNNQEVMMAKGYYLAFGHTKAAPPAGQVKNSAHPSAAENADNSDFDIDPYILSAFIALGLGLVLSLLRSRYAAWAAFVLGLAAIALLVYFYFAYKTKADTPPSGANAKLMAKVHITVDLLYGYWLVLGFSALAAIASLLSLVLAKKDMPGARGDTVVPDMAPQADEGA